MAKHCSADSGCAHVIFAAYGPKNPVTSPFYPTCACASGLHPGQTLACSCRPAGMGWSQCSAVVACSCQACTHSALPLFPGLVQGQLYVVLSSAHGMACPLPMVDHIQWAFSQRSGKVQGCPGALVCDGLYMRRHGGNDLKHEAQMSEVVSQRSSKATRVPVYAASNCKLEDQNAVEYEEGVSEVVAESTGCQQSWVSAEWLKEEAELATAGPSAAAIDSDFVHCSGEVTVDGNEGPITFSVDLNAWPAKSVKASLCLQLTFGCGADACLRNQRVVLDIAVNEVPCIPLVSSAEKMWQAAESCQAALEIKTQVHALSSFFLRLQMHPPFQWWLAVQLQLCV